MFKRIVRKVCASTIVCCALLGAGAKVFAQDALVPSIHFLNGPTWLRGEKNNAIVRVDNPGTSPLEAELELSASAFHTSQHTSIAVPAHGTTQIIFRVEAPVETRDNLVADLVSTLRSGNRAIASAQFQVTVHAALMAIVDAPSGVVFPRSEDQLNAIVHPTLASVNLPGATVLHIRVKNWSEQLREVGFGATGANLEISLPVSRLEIPAGTEKSVELAATPLIGTGLYRLFITMNAANFQFREEIAIAAVAEREALAYAFDYDHDGFDDVILENRDLRCFISPHAGGRSFAFVRKDTNSNAFDSEGGLRDHLITPNDVHDPTAQKWLELYNRPYSFRIESATGRKAVIELDVEAADMYPRGVQLKRMLSLAGDQDMLVETTAITPHGKKRPQALVLESSVPFRIAGQPSYNQWFAEGRPTLDFEAGKKITLPAGLRFIGTHNEKKGETFTIVLLTKPHALEIVSESDSALFRLTFPNFRHANRTYTYMVGYSIEKQLPELH
jgi:hypothetical protein